MTDEQLSKYLELNSKLQQKKNSLRKALKEKGVLAKGATNTFLTGVTTMTRKMRKKMNDLIVKSESGGMELSSSALNTLMKYEETLAAVKADKVK